jgi:DNA primase
MPPNDANPIDFAAIKAQHPIDGVIEALYGLQAAYGNAHSRQYHCPKHADHGPSLTAYLNDNHLKCWAGCTWNNKTMPDVFDVIMDALGIPLLQAVAWLGHTLPAAAPRPQPARLPANTGLPLWKLDEGLQHQDRAVAAMAKRGISRASVVRWQIGCWPTY